MLLAEFRQVEVCQTSLYGTAVSIFLGYLFTCIYVGGLQRFVAGFIVKLMRFFWVISYLEILEL